MHKTFDVYAIDPRYSSELQLMQTKVLDYDLRIKVQDEADVAAPKPYQVTDGIGVYAISGPLLSEGDSFTKWLGYSDYPSIRNDIAALAQDPEVKEVLLLMRTPGGSVYGVSNAADAIGKLNAMKPVYAYTDKTCCSGGYWLAAPAKEILSAPEAGSGSIGVIVTHFSYEKYLEKEGITVTVIKSDELKAVGGAMKDLSEKEKAHIQDEVDQYDRLFKQHVHDVRPKVQLHMMQAQTFIGEEALKVGLIDGVMSFDDTIAHIKSQRTQTQGGIYHMKFSAQELKTALDAGKTLADLGITEAERDEIMASAKEPSAEEKLQADLAASETLLTEAQAQITGLTDKLAVAEGEVAQLKEAAASRPDVNVELKQIVCGLIENRRLALGMQKVDMSAFSVETIMAEYKATTAAYEKAFVEGSGLNRFKQPEEKPTNIATDSVHASQLKAASYK